MNATDSILARYVTDFKNDGTYTLNLNEEQTRKLWAEIDAQTEALATVERDARQMGLANVGLMRDAARLDWLDEFRCERDAVFEEGDPDVGLPSCWQIWVKSRGQPKMIHYAPSLRAAIDGARANKSTP